MADTFFIEGLNTLPEQVQLNKEDIKKLSDSNTTQTEQIQALNTKVDTNTSNITTNTTDIDNLSKKVYDNGTISFYLDSDLFIFKNKETDNYFYIHLNSSSSNEWVLGHVDIFAFDCSVLYINRGKLHINGAIYTNSLYIHNIQITKISNSNDTDSSSLLTGKAINDTFLTKTDASNTYATKNELSNANKRIDALDTGTFDVDLTTSGLAKIKANVSIGTPITLTENTDFSQYLDYTNYKTVIFTLYMDDEEEYFISKDIKLNVGDTADVYGDNDQNYTWLTGIGVIKLGPNLNGNNYLCYISYSQGYTSPLVITPIQKLA